MSKSKTLFIFGIGLTLFGLIMVGSASVVDAARSFGDKWYYLKLQSMWSVVGFLSLLFFSKFDHRKLQKYAFTLFLVTILMLILVLIPGFGIKVMGARRWLNFGFSLQPSEIAKITLAIYFSSLLSRSDKFFQFVFTMFTILGLVMLEPDLGTTLVLAGMGFILYFGSGGKLRNLFMVAGVGILSVFALIIVSPYRLGRLKSYMDVSHDPLGASYQIRQALIALGSGGIFGHGLGQSRQKYNFLPESTTDSIFAIIGEEWGLVGAVLILLAYLVIVLKGFQIAKEAKNHFSANLAIALTSVLAFQAFINISAITALVPLTGIPLTFVSYGGSSLVIMLSALGMLINISKTYE